MLPLILLILTGSVGALVVSREAGSSPIKVSISSTGNTEIKAVLFNAGNAPLKLLNSGTLLDHAPVNKVHVEKSKQPVAFDGIIRMLAPELYDDAFTYLDAQQSIELTMDLAESYDVLTGGVHTIFAKGEMAYAEMDSTTLIGTIPYESNQLTVDINGTEATSRKQAFHQLISRPMIDTTCTGNKLTILDSAYQTCTKYALAAANAAINGSATKFMEYFNTNASSARTTVSARYKAVAAECSAAGGSKTSVSCGDGGKYCSRSYVAYTLDRRNALSSIVYCDYYFTTAPALPAGCWRNSRATTTLHENTHVSAVYNPGTGDLAYEKSAIKALSASQTVVNAECYEQYSAAIALGC